MQIFQLVVVNPDDLRDYNTRETIYEILSPNALYLTLEGAQAGAVEDANEVRASIEEPEDPIPRATGLTWEQATGEKLGVYEATDEETGNVYRIYITEVK